LLQEAGHPVRALVRPGSDAGSLERSGVEVVRGDLREPASLGPALAAVDTVVTTANAISRILAGGTDLTIAAVDGEGNQNLIRAPRPLAYAGSCSCPLPAWASRSPGWPR
jgi:uncharacterized protein YbjT (DUF2867 family)